MKNKESAIDTGKTFLRSTSHLIVRDAKGNRLRSLLVGLQFGIIHLPGELVTVTLWPFVCNIARSISYLFDNTLFVLQAALQAIVMGVGGYLEASETVIEDNKE